MKFTNGYWLIRPNFQMQYATQAVRVEKRPDTLHVLSACRPIHHRGDTLDGGTLDVTFTAPRENIIRVTVTHFAGKRDNAPHFETYEEPVNAVIEENDETVSFTSGKLTARVQKGENWRVDYVAEDGRVLTSSAFRGMGRALDKDTGKTYMSDSLMLDVGECVYGLGERFAAYVKNGQSIDMWNADGGTASEQTYKNIPFYMTNRGYGVFVEDTSDVSFEVASEKVERVQFSAEGETIVYDVIYGGTPKAVLDGYTALTGRPALMPAWSFGLWLSTSFTTNYDEKTATSFIQGMADRDIPLSVFHFDCFWMKGFNWCDFTWDEETFPDPVGMLKRYHDRGLHLCCWINPYIGQASPLFREGMEHGYLLKKTNGDVWQTDLWQAGMGILDVTNPDARAWYCDHLRKILRMGVDCLKTDFGERIPVRDIAYYDGKDPLHMHNYYTFLYNKMVFDLLKEERGEGEAILFARSATAGSQQFPVHWGGDNSASYVSMAETLRAGLSMSHSGFGFWSHDISGFEQTAPVRKFTRLKCRLMPYLYGAAVEAHEHGTPMMRPMMLEFPDDPACDTLDRQYMMGESLLVAPVFHADSHVDYYLPDGLWTSLLDGRKVQGGHWQKETHDFLSLPLMVRPGTVLPMGKHDDRPDYDYTDGLELHVYQLAEGQTVTVKIPDLKGQLAATYTVTMRNGKAEVATDSKKPHTVVVHE